jgi:hypothetical protein
MALPEEAARIAAFGRDLILHAQSGAGLLPKREVGWLLAVPRRIACLVDFLAASEDLGRVLSTPLLVTFRETGEVRWRFGAHDARPSQPVAAPGAYRWPMATAAENRVSIVCVRGATK